MPSRASPCCKPLRRRCSRQAASVAGADLDAWNAESDSARLTFLESRLKTDLELACKQAGKNSVFTFAALAGDCVLLHFLAAHGHLGSGTQVIARLYIAINMAHNPVDDVASVCRRQGLRGPAAGTFAPDKSGRLQGRRRW